MMIIYIVSTLNWSVNDRSMKQTEKKNNAKKMDQKNKNKTENHS